MTHLRSGGSAEAQRALVQLQRQYGNRHVQRILKIARQAEEEEEELQAQREGRDEEEITPLRLQPRDSSRHVARFPEVARQGDEEEAEIQAQREDRDEGEVAPEVETAINRKRGGGQPLDSAARAQMGGAFGADFSGVRIHTDTEADTLNRALGARAFTTGRDVFFRQGEYSPATSSGQELLAHELTHVVQQSGEEIRGKLTVSQPGDPLEREADRTARAVKQLQADSVGRFARRDSALLQTGIEPRAIVRRAPPQTITFEEPEVVVGHVTELGADVSGVDVARFIDHEIVGELERKWDTLVMNYLGGIDNFQNYMEFPPSAEANADYLKAAFKFAGEQLLKAAVDQIKEKVPGFDIAVDFVKAMMAEHERAAEAARRIKVRDYITTYRTSILAENQRYKDQIGELDGRIQQEFSRRTREAPELATPSPTEVGERTARVIAGPGAEYLNSLKRAIERWRVPSPSAVLQTILEQWVRTREDVVESKGGGAVYMGGRIYLKVRLYKDEDEWRIEERPRKAKLAAPEAERTVDALERTMRDEGQTINDLAIRKVLTIEVEDEVFGFNDYYRVYLHYYNPDHITYDSGCIPSPVSRETVEKAREIGHYAVEFVNRRELGVTDLEAY